MSKLQDVRDLLADPASWTQLEYNDDEDKPTCFCLMGALNHVWNIHDADNDLWAYRLADIEALALTISGDQTDRRDYELDVIAWNDEAERTHEQVLALLDKVLETQNA